MHYFLLFFTNSEHSFSLISAGYLPSLTFPFLSDRTQHCGCALKQTRTQQSIRLQVHLWPETSTIMAENPNIVVSPVKEQDQNADTAHPPATTS